MSPTILVVEDDDSIRNGLIACLAGGATHPSVDGARDGVEALHQLATRHYSVLVLDLMMPKMSGVDLLDSLAALDEDPTHRRRGEPPAVIVITAASDDFLPTETLIRRYPIVRDVQRKPLALDRLLAAIERVTRPNA